MGFQHAVGSASLPALLPAPCMHAVGVEADAADVERLLKELEGKDIHELIAAGREKLQSVPSGGAVAAAAPAAGGAAAGAAAGGKAEAKKEEPSEEDEVCCSGRPRAQLAQKASRQALIILLPLFWQ